MNKTKRLSVSTMVTLSIIISMFTNSCTVYYNTSDIKKTFSKAQREANKVVGEIAKDRTEKQGIYKQLTSSVSDIKLAPYPTLQKHLVSMSSAFVDLKEANKELETLKAQFAKLAKGRKKIESNSSVWKEYQTIQTKYESTTEKFQSLALAYNKASNNFIDTLNKFKISQISVPELQQKVDDYLKDLDRSIHDLSTAIIKNKELLASAGRNNNSQASQAKTLDELEAIVTDVQHKRGEMHFLVKGFQVEVGVAAMVWSGPGMKSFTLYNDIQNTGKEITHLGEKFDAIAKHL